MPAGATYEPIATQTLGSNTTTVTFSSISQSYTDLILVMNVGEATAYSNGIRFRVGNGSVDTGSNYSNIYLIGNGSTATSQNQTSLSYFDTAWNGAPGSSIGTYNQITHFQSYSDTTSYKTILTRPNTPASSTEANVGLWRSTSAINVIDIYTSGGSGNQLITGSIFTLYGIKAA